MSWLYKNKDFEKITSKDGNEDIDEDALPEVVHNLPPVPPPDPDSSNEEKKDIETKQKPPPQKPSFSFLSDDDFLPDDEWSQIIRVEKIS